MIQIINLFFYYFLIIFSAIGYGMLASLNLGKKEKVDFGFFGLTGILILILFSYFSNLFFIHGYLHNSIIILIGFSIFNFVLIKNFSQLKKNFQMTVIVFSILFIGLLMYKNHDDFFYYHFQYTLSLIHFEKIFGLGLMGHGYRTPSSLFYLNSLFYLPGIKYYLLNAGAIIIMGFANVILLNKILEYFKSKNYNFILFLISLTFIYINATFYRLAEHGTDRSALILIFIFSIIYLESLNIKKKYNIGILENYYEKIVILITLIASFKSFYLIYFLFIIIWLLQIKNFWTIKESIKVISSNKFTYLSFFTVSAVLFSIFSNTGCLIYPASFTCFENFAWTISTETVDYMKAWYELWSKAGANPNNRVADPALYIQNFNWVSRWFNDYFFTKVSDFLLIILLISTIMFFYLNPLQKKLKKKNIIEFKMFYLMIILFTLEWFVNHPALRYGGYTLFTLLLFIPTSIYLSKFEYNFINLQKKLSVLLVVSIVIFYALNVKRIIKENKKYAYNPFTNPYFYIDRIGFNLDTSLRYIKDNLYQNKNNDFFILNEDIVSEEKIKNK